MTSELRPKQSHWLFFATQRRLEFSENNIAFILDQMKDLKSNEIMAEIDKLETLITTSIKEALINSTPKRSSTKKPKSVPWWNTELKQQRKLVKTLRKQKQRIRTDLAKETYRKERNKYNHMIRKSKYDNFKNTCNNAKDPWDFMNKIVRGRFSLRQYQPFRKMMALSFPVMKKQHNIYLKNGSQMIVHHMTMKSNLVYDN